MNTVPSPANFWLAATPLFLVLFIDSMGLGLVFPILNALIVNPASNFLTSANTADARNFLFGLTIGIFMLCWFFGAALLGDLSDHIGRKKSLLICLLGAFLGYLFSALGVSVHSFALVLIGRIIAGFTAGSQAIAQAAIVDISIPEHKARNLGLILFFISIGFIVGPLLGGVLSDSGFVSWFSLATPFFFAALLSLINAVLLSLFFKETFQTTSKQIKIKLHGAITIFISAFQHPQVRYLSIILLVMVFGWSGFYNFIAMFLLREFNLSTLSVSLYMAVMGVGFGLGTGLLVEFCTKRYTQKNIIVVGAIITTAAILLTLISPRMLYAWLAIIPLGAAGAVTYSVLLNLFSNQVDAQAQGWVMGITGAIMAFAFGMNGIIVGLLANISPKLPMLIAAIGYGGSGYLMHYYQKRINMTPLSQQSTPPAI